MALKMFNFLRHNQINPWEEVPRVIFRWSASLFAVLALLEAVLPGFAGNWLNPMYLLIIAIINGIVMIVIAKKN